MLEPETLPVSTSRMVSEAPLRSIVSIAAFKNAGTKLNEALGATLPATPASVAKDGVLYLWSGPESWLAIGGELAKLTTIYAAVTEQTDGRAVFSVTGRYARDALAKLVPIDLHDNVFPPGATALTLAGHIGVQIWREGEIFQLACFRSFAQSLYASLIEACREFEG